MTPPSSPALRVAGTVGGLAALGIVAHLAPGVVAWRRARCIALPALSGVGRLGHVALTFDDGPDPTSTPAILDTLDVFGWKATFFCLGAQARRDPGLVRELVARGHELGVHGETHRSHLGRSAPAVVADVRSARALIEDLSDRELRWLRPPYGAVAASTLVAAHRTGLRLILWTTWGIDWKAGATGPSVAANVERTFVPGATVLLHDSDVTSAPQSWKATVDALPLLAARWHAEDLEVGTLSDHF